MIIEENLKIRFDRKKLFEILNKSNTSSRDKAWLELKFKQYGINNNDLTKLKIRMDEIPVSLAIAQAAKETGWEARGLRKKVMHYLDSGHGQVKVLSL